MVTNSHDYAYRYLLTKLTLLLILLCHSPRNLHFSGKDKSLSVGVSIITVCNSSEEKII